MASAIFIMLPSRDCQFTHIEEILNSESKFRTERSFCPKQFGEKYVLNMYDVFLFTDNEQVGLMKDISFCAQPGETTAIIRIYRVLVETTLL